MESDFERLLARARRGEQLRRQAHRQEAGRGTGVSWSGLGPGGYRPRSEAALVAQTGQSMRRLEAWRAGPDGQLLSTLVEAQRAAQAAYGAAESARAALARASDGPPPLAELSLRVAELARAARQAAALIDQIGRNALSDRACATNIASGSRSTASPSSSAS